jgi:hypothetical protein
MMHIGSTSSLYDEIIKKKKQVDERSNDTSQQARNRKGPPHTLVDTFGTPPLDC